jgi:hypothetical protein
MIEIEEECEKLVCKHQFHSTCMVDWLIDNWKQGDADCPMCQHTVQPLGSDHACSSALQIFAQSLAKKLELGKEITLAAERQLGYVEQPLSEDFFSRLLKTIKDHDEAKQEAASNREDK